MIDEIAFQTNLLALNAAVEAAREIKTLIKDSVARVQDGSRLVDESGRHLNDIVAAAKKVAEINAEMAQQGSAVADSMTRQAQELTNLDWQEF